MEMHGQRVVLSAAGDPGSLKTVAFFHVVGKICFSELVERPETGWSRMEAEYGKSEPRVWYD